MNNKTRLKSPLATIQKLSPNKNIPRNKAIRRLTPHCVAGNLSIESTLGLANFQSGGGASTSYAIGSDGRIGLCVEETNRPWTSSSAANDHEAITFEIANNGGAPDWRMSDAAINAWLDLSVEICQFYGYQKVNYQEKPANITYAQVETWIKTWAKDDEIIITLHCWYANKACPGPYFIRQIPWLVKEMNKRLADLKCIPEAFVGEGATASQVSSTAAFQSYEILIAVSALNVRKGPGTDNAIVKTLVNDKNVYTIVEEKDGPSGNGTTGKWGKLKSGLGWILLSYTKRR